MQKATLLESLKITKRHRKSLPLAEGVLAPPFSFLLSPLRSKQHFAPASKTKQKIAKQRSDHSRFEQIKSRIIPSIKEKMPISVKACTIDFAGSGLEGETIEFKRRMGSTIKCRNGKSLRSRKSKGGDRYTVYQSIAKCHLDSSLEMRVRSLGIGLLTHEEESRMLKQVRRAGRADIFAQNKGRSTRYLDPQRSKLRQKQRAKNIRSVMLEELRPWDSIEVDEQQGLL